MSPDLSRAVAPRALGEDRVEQRELLLLVVVRGEGERLELAWLEVLASRRSALRRRTATSRSARSSRLAPRLNRRASIISSSAVNDSEWPLCGVADRNSRCSHFSASARAAIVRWLSTA